LEDREKYEEERKKYSKWNSRIQSVGSGGYNNGNTSSSVSYGSYSNDSYDNNSTYGMSSHYKKKPKVLITLKINYK